MSKDRKKNTLKKASRARASSVTPTLLELRSLRPHEEILPARLQEMIEKISRRRYFHKPILVDRETLTILDGHHKYNAARHLGLERVPVVMVDYLADERIELETWPDSGIASLSKEQVVEMGQSEGVFPPKSSRHTVPFELPRLKIPLKKLR